MDKKKFLAASLASVAVLGLAFATSQPSVVKAEEETTAQNEFLANFDKALDQTVKALEEEAKNNPESADQIKETIAHLKAEAAKNRAEFEEGFKNGVTAKAAEEEVEEVAKAEEAAEEAEAQEEAAAQKEFLANFDKALEDAIAELKKADTQNDPELAKQVEDTITKLKTEAAKQKSQIEEGFKNGLTVEAAEKAIDDANKEAAAEEAEAKKEEAAQKDFLANYDKALEEAVKAVEAAKTNSPEEAKAKADTIAALKAASDQTRAAIVEGFKKGLTAKQAEVFIDELNKKAAAEDKEATNKKAEGTTKIESSNGQNATINEVPEFNEPLTGHFDIADLGNPNAEAIEEGEVGESKPKEIKGYKFVRTVKDGNVTKHYYKKLNTPASAEIPTPDFPIPAKVGTPGNPPRENSDTKAVNEPALVPTTPAAPGTDASATSTAETPATPAVAPTVAGTNKDNTYQAPAAKAEDKKELPNTGGKDNVAVASLGFLGLLLGALPFVKRKN